MGSKKFDIEKHFETFFDQQNPKSISNDKLCNFKTFLSILTFWEKMVFFHFVIDIFCGGDVDANSIQS